MKVKVKQGRLGKISLRMWWMLFQPIFWWRGRKERQKGGSKTASGGQESDNSRVLSLHRGGREKAQWFTTETWRRAWIRNYVRRCFDLSIFFQLITNTVWPNTFSGILLSLNISFPWLFLHFLPEGCVVGEEVNLTRKAETGNVEPWFSCKCSPDYNEIYLWQV